LNFLLFPRFAHRVCADTERPHAFSGPVRIDNCPGLVLLDRGAKLAESSKGREPRQGWPFRAGRESPALARKPAPRGGLPRGAGENRQFWL